jgi:uncharacterized protein (DUF924 family)
MDTHRSRTGTAVAGNGHDAYRKTVHARASATYNRGVGDAMISTSQDKSIPPVRRIFPFHGMNLFLS